MKNLLKYCLVLTFLSYGNAFAGWKALLNDEVASEYVNPDSAERNNYFVTMWNMSDFATPQEVGNGRLFKSSKTLQEYNCLDKKRRLLRIVHFSENMGLGQVVFNDATLGEWFAIKTGSLSEAHYKVACATPN
jgi:hypothetical protein